MLAAPFVDLALLYDGNERPVADLAWEIWSGAGRYGEGEHSELLSNNEKRHPL